MVATGAAVVLIDKLGRKILLVASGLTMCISIIGLGVYFYLDECSNPFIHPDNDPNDCTDTSSFGWLPLVIIRLFVLDMLGSLSKLVYK